MADKNWFPDKIRSGRFKYYIELHKWFLFSTAAKQASPFHIRHMTDGFEFTQGAGVVEATAQNKGFRLTYEMDCN